MHGTTWLVSFMQHYRGTNKRALPASQEFQPQKKRKEIITPNRPSSFDTELLQKVEELKTLKTKFNGNEKYQAFGKIFEYVYKNINRFRIQKIAGIDFLCLPASPSTISEILQSSPNQKKFAFENLGDDNNPISSQSFFHNKKRSLNDGAIQAKGNMYNFHYDDVITDETNGISICWMSCVSKRDIEKCGTFVANDNENRIDEFENTTGLPLDDDGKPLVPYNLPLDHIIIANFGKLLHSPPTETYLNEFVFTRLFLSIELNPNNVNVQEFTKNVAEVHR